MYCEGREKEIKKILSHLQRGENIILTGKYGIGRTTLMKHIAAIAMNRWRFLFLDFSQTPGQMIKQMSAMLSPKKNSKSESHCLRYKYSRSFVVRVATKNKYSTVLVLDDVARLTNPKLRLLQYLVLEGKFQFVVIVESFLPEEDLFRLRAALLPMAVIKLRYLNEVSTVRLLHHLAVRYSFNWPEPDIHLLAAATHGYPLGVHDLVVRELERQQQDGCRQ